MSIKQPKDRKSLHPFATTLYIKPNTAVYRLCAVKPKRKAIRAGMQLWYKIPKSQVRTKTN